jgi:hypothetical protein
LFLQQLHHGLRRLEFLLLTILWLLVAAGEVVKVFLAALVAAVVQVECGLELVYL